MPRGCRPAQAGPGSRFGRWRRRADNEDGTCSPAAAKAKPGKWDGKDGGAQAANLKVAEQYINAFAYLAKTNNTMIVPTNVADIAGVVATAMSVLDKTKAPPKA